jgi:transposase InsO family protein
VNDSKSIRIIANYWANILNEQRFGYVTYTWKHDGKDKSNPISYLRVRRWCFSKVGRLLFAEKSRFVLSWEVSVTMEDNFCISAVESAIRRHGKPQVFNSDQGVQYTSNDFTGMLQGHGIEISMDGKGRWMDNVFIERLWRSVKYEEIYTREYGSVRDLINALRRYFEFYNFERRHQSLNEQTPAEMYYGTQQLAKAA